MRFRSCRRIGSGHRAGGTACSRGNYCTNADTCAQSPNGKRVHSNGKGEKTCEKNMPPCQSRAKDELQLVGFESISHRMHAHSEIGLQIPRAKVSTYISDGVVSGFRLSACTILTARLRFSTVHRARLHRRGTTPAAAGQPGSPRAVRSVHCDTPGATGD